jgi:undecaprenyl diphosphate synthase
MVYSETKIKLVASEVSPDEWVTEIKKHWETIPEFRVDSERLRHLAIICDGNRRAAKERGLHPYYGHQAGVEAIREIAKTARQWGIRTLTFWTWSTENWEREREQVRFVMGLAERLLPDRELIKELQENQVKFTHLGRKDRLPGSVRMSLESLESQTGQFEQYRLNLAMDYGGLDEAARAMVKMLEAFGEGTLNPEMIKENPQVILGFLDTATQVLPDLVIRTGVKKEEIPHTSGFMPLQTAYAGWVFLPDLFPDLTPESLLLPIKEFLEYERRRGR